MPKLYITPQTALLDEPLTIKIEGLEAHQNIKIRASLTDAKSLEWASEASYQADENGEVNLATHKPIDALYHNADPMGLIWSMCAVDEDKRYQTFAHSPKLDPFKIRFSLSVKEEIVATQEVERQYLAPHVQCIEVRENGLFGTLFIPAGEKPHPAITLVSGSSGGLSEYRAALYAAHGYAALALAYFNYETLPKLLMEIPLEYFEKSIHYLQSRADIDSERLAITGRSRGGELSLLLGSLFPQYKAVLANVPSGIVWGAIGNNLEEGNKAAWLYQEQVIPFMDNKFEPDIYDYFEDYQARGEAIPATPSYSEIMRRNPDLMRESEISVENIKGAILLISSEADQLWPSKALTEIAIQRLKTHNFQYPYEHLTFADAGHFIDLPYTPTTVTARKHPVTGGFYDYGGTPQGNYHMSRDSWQKILAFLDQHL